MGLDIKLLLLVQAQLGHLFLRIKPYDYFVNDNDHDDDDLMIPRLML